MMNYSTQLRCLGTIILTSLSLTTYAQYEDTDRGHDGFIGDVKSVKFVNYEPVVDGDKVSRGSSAGYDVRSYLKDGQKDAVMSYNPEGIVTRSEKYSYDKKGNLLESQHYMGEMLFKKMNYTYDKKGNLLEEITYDGEGAINKKIAYTYDSKGNLIQQVNFSQSYGELLIDEKQELKYDADGNNISTHFSDPDGNSWGWQENKYDDRGNLIEWTNFTETGEIKVIQTYTYNADDIAIERKTLTEDRKLQRLVKLDRFGQPMLMEGYDEEGNITRKSGSKFDDYGNITAEFRIDAEGNESVGVEFKYKYDNQNNWIEQIAFQNGAPAYITSREIAYY